MLKPVETIEIPKNAVVTPFAMMPRVFCCIEGETAKVFVNRVCIRRFKHYENGMKKLKKVGLAEQMKAERFYNSIAGKAPLYIFNRRKRLTKSEPKPVKIGFEYVI